MPKSGPRELAAYHAAILEKERKPNKMASALFDTEKLDADTVETATARTARILAEAENKDKPAATPTLHAPAGHPNPPAQAPTQAPPNGDSSDSKKQRTTVPKLLAKFKARAEEMDAAIAEAQQIINEQESRITLATAEKKRWLEIVAEIEAD
jgi:hypothetical protein